MNVLLVAPELGLKEAANEVRQVSIALKAVILSGTVTRKDLVDMLGSSTWDVIWFATHGNPTGIMLSDALVNISDLTAIVRNSSAYLVVLNSCSSRYVGLELHYELGVDVITTETDADDLRAFQTGTLLAKNLAAGLSVQDAFDKSRPGQNNLYYLFTRMSRDDEDEIRTIQMLNEAVATIKTVIADSHKLLAERVDKLESRIDQKVDAEVHRLDEVSRIVYALDYMAKTPQATLSKPHLLDGIVVILLAGVMVYLLILNILERGLP